MTSSERDVSTGSTRPPLVTILITAHGRPDELRVTLRALRAQTYPALELVVVDDASPEPLEPVVRAEWPEVRFWRNPTNRGYIASRSFGLAQARGAYIVTLDDDSHPVAPDALARAVARCEREPEIGVVAFRVHEGTDPPADDPGPAREHYTYAFVGCAHLTRARAAREVGGYRDFFEYYKEEAEYALRLIDRGWRILYFPEVVVHHRLSAVGRSDARITAYSFRNALWTALLDLPWPRLLAEVPWKVAVGGSEMVRKGSLRWLAWGVRSTLAGLPRVLRERAPISAGAARMVDVLKFREVADAAALEAAVPPTPRERWAWFRTVWWRRRRARAFWDQRPGALGEGAWMTRPPGA